MKFFSYDAITRPKKTEPVKKNFFWGEKNIWKLDTCSEINLWPVSKSSVAVDVASLLCRKIHSESVRARLDAPVAIRIARLS